MEFRPTKLLVGAMASSVGIVLMHFTKKVGEAVVRAMCQQVATREVCCKTAHGSCG